MIMAYFVLVFILFSLESLGAQECSKVLSDLALNDPEHMIAHSTHSLTLNMIRYYFYPNATEENGIATVNLNHSDPRHLHQHAIWINVSNGLDYGPFFALDNVLSHMDDTEYGIGNSNTLDQIAHGMHMHHMWNCASKKYKELVSSPPTNNKTCDCLINTYKDDIRTALLNIAKLIRTPDEIGSLRRRARRQSYHYSGRYIGRIKSVGRQRSKHQPVVPIERDPNRGRDLYNNNIKDEASWEAWKEIMKEPSEGYTQEVGKSLAYYMFCHFHRK